MVLYAKDIFKKNKKIKKNLHTINFHLITNSKPEINIFYITFNTATLLHYTFLKKIDKEKINLQLINIEELIVFRPQNKKTKKKRQKYS